MAQLGNTVVNGSLRVVGDFYANGYIDTTVTLTAAGWSGTDLFTQTVNVAGVKADNNYRVYQYISSGATAAEIKTYLKNFSCVTSGYATPADGSITFTTIKKPTANITIRIVGDSNVERTTVENTEVTNMKSDIASINTDINTLNTSINTFQTRDTSFGAVPTDQTPLKSSGQNSENDCNEMNTNGLSYYISNGPSKSLGATSSDGALYSQTWNRQTRTHEIAGDYRDGDIFTRGNNNGTWSAWKAVSYRPRLLHEWSTAYQVAAGSLSISLEAAFVLLITKVRYSTADALTQFRGYHVDIVPVDGLPYCVTCPSYAAGFTFWRYYTASKSGISWSDSYWREGNSTNIDTGGDVMIPYKLYTFTY